VPEEEEDDDGMQAPNKPGVKTMLRAADAGTGTTAQASPKGVRNGD
jgi:hypothetical protein